MKKPKGVLGFASLLRKEYDSELPEVSEISGDGTASLIVTPGGKNVHPEEVDGVNKQLPGYKRMKDIIIREDEFEKTSSRKTSVFCIRDTQKRVPVPYTPEHRESTKRYVLCHSVCGLGSVPR